MLKSKILYINLLNLLLISCSAYDVQESYEKPVLKKEVISKNTSLRAAEESLIKKANRLTAKEFKSIIDKKAIPPSGDKRDYFSRAIYYWPDPSNKENKWIYKDGKVNKKSLEETDHFTFFEAMGAVRDLSLAYNLNKDESYAKKAMQIIDQWFVDEETRMNPNFKFAQAIPGKNDGSHWGIISSRAILWVTNGLRLMEDSENITDSVRTKFVDWCSDYLEWLTTSEFGLKVSDEHNNHVTFYTLLSAELATFIEKFDLGHELLVKSRDMIIPNQIGTDGSMPEELKRTRPLHYSLFNLSALVQIAMLGDKYGLNLWEAKTDSSGSIIDATDFIVNYANENEDLKNKGSNFSKLMGILQNVSMKYEDRYDNFFTDMLANDKKIHLKDFYYLY